MNLISIVAIIFYILLKAEQNNCAYNNNTQSILSTKKYQNYDMIYLKQQSGNWKGEEMVHTSLEKLFENVESITIFGNLSLIVRLIYKTFVLVNFKNKKNEIKKDNKDKQYFINDKISFEFSLDQKAKLNFSKKPSDWEIEKDLKFTEGPYVLIILNNKPFIIAKKLNLDESTLKTKKRILEQSLNSSFSQIEDIQKNSSLIFRNWSTLGSNFHFVTTTITEPIKKNDSNQKFINSKMNDEKIRSFNKTNEIFLLLFAEINSGFLIGLPQCLSKISFLPFSQKDEKFEKKNKLQEKTDQYFKEGMSTNFNDGRILEKDHSSSISNNSCFIVFKKSEQCDNMIKLFEHKRAWIEKNALWIDSQNKTWNSTNSNELNNIKSMGKINSANDLNCKNLNGKYVKLNNSKKSNSSNGSICKLFPPSTTNDAKNLHIFLYIYCSVIIIIMVAAFASWWWRFVWKKK